MRKNIFFLITSLAFMVISCQQKEMELPRQAVEFEFQKTMTITDKNNNSVDLVVYAHSQEALNDHTNDVFELKTWTSESSFLREGNTVVTSENQNIEEDISSIDENDANFVYLYIKNYQFKDDVKAFSVRSSIEYLGQNYDARYNETFYHYSNGANGIHGARVTYTRETRSKEYIQVKFSKKTAPSNWFWQTLATGNLYNVGDVWDYCGSTEWEEYRLKVKIRKAKAGRCCYGYAWAFLLNC